MKLFLSLTLCATTVSGFTNIPQAIQTTAPPQQSTQALNLFENFNFEMPIEIPPIPSFIEDIPAALGGLFGVEQECIEECAVNEVSHALLDFSDGFELDQVFIRGMKVVGNLVVLQQSLAHLNDVLPDELLFQVGFLGLACSSLHKVVAPKIKAHNAKCLLMTPKDRKAFRSLFRPAGFSWTQFRELSLGCDAMEWVTVTPGEVIDEEAAFWLYEGEVEVISDKSSQTMTGPALLGEEHLMGLLDAGGKQLAEERTYIAGEEGASFLRLDTDALKTAMKHDDNLLTSIGSLTYTAMQKKLDALRV